MTSDNDNKPILQTRALTFSSEGIDKLKKIDYAIYPNSFHLIFGEKGAGKTLIGKIFSGKIKQTSGTVVFNGKPIAHTKKIKHQDIAFISEDNLLHKNLSMKDIIELNLKNSVAFPRKAKKIFHTINGIYNFDVSLGHLFYDLSYNEKCLFLIILSFIEKPAILIIDSILDNIPKNFLKKIFEIIHQYKNDNLSILCLSNSIDSLLDFVDHVSVLKNGELILSEPVKDIERINLIKLAYTHTPYDYQYLDKKEFYHLLKYNEAILENLPINLLIVDPAFSLKLINNSAKEFFKIKEEIHQDVSQLLGINLSDIALSPRQNKTISKTIMIHDNEFIVNLFISPIYDLKTLIGYFIIIEDITVQEQLREKLQLSDKLATIGMLATGVAHEINNPLEILFNRIDFIRESTDKQLNKKLLDEFEEELGTIAKITDNLLTFTRSSDDSQQIINLPSLIDDSILFMKRNAKLKRIEIESHSEVDEICIFANKTEIKQVFLNLIKNSLEAIKEDGKIEIDLKLSKPDNRFVKISINDTGPGINSAQINDVFLPFYSSKKNSKNTGLGLYNVYSILNKYNADITVRNLKPHGCEFTLLFPTIFYENPSIERLV
jgi:signal transduction histidine kinase/ABC-type branched-subunit amino acid transport system ATPase component